MTKYRADLLLVERGLSPSRAQAQAAIAAGQVFCGERRITRASAMLPSDAALQARAPACPWASRAGLKLVHALDYLDIRVAGRVALDVGASTGGFTDVLLARGATRVYAIDVGHDQLIPRLKNDPRIILREGINARFLSEREVPECVDVVTCDVSFIGLRLVLPAVLARAAPGADLVALIKPQFEVGPEHVGKGGIVRGPALHRRVCDDATGWLSAQAGWAVRGMIESPIPGGGGNREFLIAGHRAEMG